MEEEINILSPFTTVKYILPYVERYDIPHTRYFLMANANFAMRQRGLKSIAAVFNQRGVNFTNPEFDEVYLQIKEVMNTVFNNKPRKNLGGTQTILSFGRHGKDGSPYAKEITADAKTHTTPMPPAYRGH